MWPNLPLAWYTFSKGIPGTCPAGQIYFGGYCMTPAQLASPNSQPSSGAQQTDYMPFLLIGLAVVAVWMVMK